MAKASDSQGLATRYALLELVPFIITGDDSLYVPHRLDVADTLNQAKGYTGTDMDKLFTAYLESLPLGAQPKLCGSYCPTCSTGTSRQGDRAWMPWRETCAPSCWAAVAWIIS